MSAIAGIFYFNSAPVAPGLIELLTDVMSARGPEEQRHWGQGSVALGHGMLRTTPEARREHQPLTSADNKLALVWDGRLDNREELRRALVSNGAVLRDRSDAELVLASYVRWREECPKRLLGDFAFAVWDSVRNHLFCARDHVGARPFYYTRNARFFAFASEEEALAKIPGVSSLPNAERITYFLVPSFVNFDASHSWLEDIWTLGAAEYLTVSANGMSRGHKYWQLEPGEEHAFNSDEACQEAFLEVFGEAVRCRLRSSGPVSAMMSGGLDSASIAAMVKRLQPALPSLEFHTYSAIADHPENCVESQCIEDLTVDLGARAHCVAVPSFTGMLDVNDLINVGWSRAHPVDNSILLPAMMCLAAKRNGHHVMLHGVSGDVAMHTPNRYCAGLLRAGRWRQAWQECRSASRNHTYLRGASPVDLLLRNLWTAYAPGVFKTIRHQLHERNAASPIATSLINRQLVDKFALAEPMRMVKPRVNWSQASAQQEHIQALLPPHGITCGLEGYDRVAGRYGVELRDPWADKRVVEFCLRLPLAYRVRQGWTKFLVRAAFAADLSVRVRQRLGKEHLGWHFANRLMDESQELIAHTMAQEMATIAAYMDSQAVQRLYEDYIETKSVVAANQLHDVVTAAIWLKRWAN